MSDNPEASSDAQDTFKVKTSSDKTHNLTMAEAATVLDLKNKLAGSDFEDIPVERQRLIYSGRVMKNDDTLSTYKIKTNNTIHMVKSAASNPTQPAANAAPAPQAPVNMASGTANNPLSNLTGARYAGHQINLPGMDVFGPDGGMGPPMDEERMQRMMEDPNVQQTMNEALSNPDVVNMLIDSNPMLRNMPNAREIITSPAMRQMLSDPSTMRHAMRMQREMHGGGGSAFPAPGATDTTPGAQDGEGNAANAQGGAFDPSLFMGGGLGANPFTAAMADPQMMQRQMETIRNSLRAMGVAPPGDAGNAAASNPADGATPGQAGSTEGQNPPPFNPFASLFNPQGAQGGGGGTAAGNNNPFGMSPEMMQQMMQQFMGGGMGGGAGAAAPADNRPPEERYADQLRQLNDMGFYDFDTNIAALRRSGGSVQGAVEHLLNSPQN